MAEATIAPAAPAPSAPAAPASAPAATLSNFSAIVARNTAAAPAAPAPTPTGVQSVPAGQNGLSETAAAFNAQREQQQQPANTNAQPTTEDQQALAAELAGQQPAPAEADLVHGLAVNDIIDAIKRGELPEALAVNLKGIAKVNGQDLPISFREALNGYQRLSDYTYGSEQNARATEKLNAERQALLDLFTGWDAQDGGAALEKSLRQMGVMQNARAIFTRNWGTADKPNAQGFMDDVRRLGMWPVFQAAAQQYANWWGERYARYGGIGDELIGRYPAEQQRGLALRNDRARQMLVEDESREAAMWVERLKAEDLAAKAQQQQWSQDRAKLLAQQQVANPGEAQFRQQVETLKQQAFTAAGLELGKISDPKILDTIEQYFGENVTAWANIHKRRNEQPPIADIIAKAVQATLERVGDDVRAGKLKLNATPANTNAQPAGTVAPAAPAPRPQGLPARPIGAPVTQASSIPRGGTVSDFDARIRAIKGLPQR